MQTHIWVTRIKPMSDKHGQTHLGPIQQCVLSGMIHVQLTHIYGKPPLYLDLSVLYCAAKQGTQNFNLE